MVAGLKYWQFCQFLLYFGVYLLVLAAEQGKLAFVRGGNIWISRRATAPGPGN